MITNNNLDKELFSITTIIETKHNESGKIITRTASGFYYNQLETAQKSEPGIDNKKELHWAKVEGHWLVTNKHVVFSDNMNLVDELTFCLRKVEKKEIEWLPITINKEEIKIIMKMHQDDSVDIVALDVSQYLRSELIRNQNELIFPSALSNYNLPDNQPIEIEVTSDIIVASYPVGFYDKKNKFPIIKSGIVASAWGLFFDGLPYFQIDAQLFPGSSGGLVISKPMNLASFNRKLYHSENKQFVFLGIYSGEYTWTDTIKSEMGESFSYERSFGLGNVWYSFLVPQIIENGICYDIEVDG